MSTDVWLLILGAVAAAAGVAAAVGGIGAWAVTHRGNKTAGRALELAQRAESRASTRHAVDWQDVSEEDDCGVRLRNGGPDEAHEVTVVASWEGVTLRQAYPLVRVDETLTLDIPQRESPATQRRRHEREQHGREYSFGAPFLHMPDINVLVTWRSEDGRWDREEMRVG